MTKMPFALIMLMPLAACSANYPDLMTASAPPPSTVDSPNELDNILAEAVRLQGIYGQNYKETAQWQDYGQIPIIGAAAWAAWVLLANKDGAAAKVGKIGIGAGAYSAVRGQLSPAGLTDAYIAGHGALTCVIAEGSVFTGQIADRRHQDVDDELQSLANSLAGVAEYRWIEPADAAQNREALKAARAVADQASASARTAETAALLQLGAFDSAPPIFRNAVSAISVRVASKGRVRPTIDFGTLKDSLAPPKAPENIVSQDAGSKSRPTDSSTVIGTLMARTSTLLSGTARLTAIAPPYSRSLTNVASCPDLIK
jgi:hypothetical protein